MNSISMTEKQRQFHSSPLYQTLHFYLGECPDWPTIEHRLWWQFNQTNPALRFNRHELAVDDLYVSSLETEDFKWWFEVWQKYQKAVAQIGPKSRAQPFQKAVEVPWPWMAGIPRKLRKKYSFPPEK